MTICFAVAVQSVLHAAEVEGDPSAAAASVRQIFVPADRPDVWPTHGETFLPVAPEQLRELLRQAEKSSAVSNKAMEHAVEAIYYARYIVNRLIDGQGSIVVHTDREQPMLLDWPHAGAMIRNARWKDREAEPAQLGAWGTEGPSNSRSALLANHSGILLFNFQAVASEQSDGSAKFSVVSPSALRRRLYVDLPEEHELIAQTGSVVQITESLQTVSGQQGSLMELPPLGIKYRRWQLTSGPGGAINFEVKQPPPTAGVRTDAASYRERLSYLLQPQGMVLTAVFQFAEGDQLPPDLTIDVDPDVHLVGIFWDGAATAWQKHANGTTGTKQVRISVPAKRDGHAQLRIEAWGKLAGEQLRILPLISVPGLFWSEGVVEIKVAEEMELLDLRAPGLTPLVSAQTGPPNGERVWQFAKLRQASMPEVALRSAKRHAEAHIGTSIELSSASTKAVIRMQVRASGRMLPPHFEAEVLGGWVIDSVESSTEVGSSDWHVDQVGDHRLLRVQFREPGDAAFPGDVVIEAHLPKSAVQGLSLAELMPMNWQSLDPERHILAVTVIEPFDLHVEGDLDKLTFDDLTEQDWELLQDSEVSVLLLAKQANPNTTFRLLPESPIFDAEVEIEIEAGRGLVRQAAVMRIESLRNSQSKLRVLISPAPEGEISWIDPQSNAQLPAVRLTPAKPELRAKESWEVQLPRGATGSQSLLARWSQKPTDHLRIPLIAIPEANNQIATVRVRGAAQGDFDLIATGMMHHTLEPPKVNTEIGREAIYRYDPSELMKASSERQLALELDNPRKSGPQTVIESVQILSRYSQSNESLHQAEFSLNGTFPLRCRLPEGACAASVAWNGDLVPHTLHANELRLNSPPTAPAPSGVLRIDFSLPQQALHDGLSIEAPMPDLELPISSGRWLVQLPSRFAMATPDYLKTLEPGWRGRLFKPWANPSVDSGVSSVAGWRNWEVSFAGSLPNPIPVVLLNQRWALAVGLGIAAACWTSWQLLRRPRLALSLLGVAGIAALWLPPTTSMFATTVWLGMLSGIMWTAVAHALDQRRFSKFRHRAKGASLPAKATPGIVAICLISPATFAEDVSPIAISGPGADVGNIAEVMIPVDPSGVPTGEQYFVPARLLEGLLRTSQQNRKAFGGDWVIQRGRYQGELRQEAVGDDVQASVWSLSWEVDVQRQNARVSFPLVSGQGEWQPTASVDGIPVPIEWGSDGRGCNVPVREPGVHRITIRVEPHVREDGDRGLVQLDLPPLLDAELQLIYPNGFRDLKHPASTNPTAADAQRLKVVYPLPDSTRLELNWGLSAHTSPTDAAWEVEQRDLMSVSPNGTELEVRLQLRGSGTPPTEITVAADGALEPLDTQTSLQRNDTAQETRTLVKAPVVISSTPTLATQATATARFRVPRNQVLGNYRFPQVEVLGLVTRSKVAAVSLSEGFNYETIQSPIGETMEASDFAQLWGDSRANFAAAYRILGDQTPWTMAVQPRAVALPPEESMLVSCGIDELRVEFRAYFTPGGAPLAQQTLRVSPELRVQSVEVERSADSQALVWTRPAPDRVVAFFSEPFTGDYRLILSATAPVRSNQVAQLPAVTTRPEENLYQHVQIYRQSECIVQIHGRNQSDPEPEAFSPWGAEAYLVESFRDRRDQVSRVAVEVQKNSPKSVAQSVTIFDPEVGVTFRSRIRVTQGILDRLGLEVPADWIGPLDISPSAEVIEQGDVADGRRQMQIQLDEPVPAGHAVELRFNGSIAATSDRSWIVPVLRLLGPSSESVSVVVPGDESRTVESWTFEGAVPADLPLALAQETDLPPEPRAFQVLPDRQQNYSIRLSPAAEETPLASLALADVYVYMDESGAQMCRTQFLLPPIASNMLTVQWPAEHEPIAAYLENQLLQPSSVDDHHWQLPIGPTDLPFILTIVTRAAASSAPSVHLHRPRLWDHKSEYPLQLTLWSVEAPQSLKLVGDTPRDDATVGELTFLRLARMTQLVVAAEPRLANLSASDRNAWSQLWTERLRAESVALEQSGAQVQPEQSTVGAEDNRPREQLITQLNQLLGRITPTADAAILPTNVGGTGIGPSQSAPAGVVQRSNFIVGGPQSSLQLQPSPGDQPTALARASLTLFIVAVVGALLRRTTSVDLARLLASHPRSLVAALGVTCLFVVPLPAFGAALITAALVSWAGERWLDRKSSASTL